MYGSAAPVGAVSARRQTGRDLMQGVTDAVTTGAPAALRELTSLGRTLKKRAKDVLAYFDRPGISNDPTEAINGRLEHPGLRPRLPQPHPLHRPITLGSRRLQTPATPRGWPVVLSPTWQRR
jgi:hypothetical protein